MANTGAAGKGGRGGQAGEKTGGSDTLNFTYSSAVEAALEQFEKDKEQRETKPARTAPKKNTHYKPIKKVKEEPAPTDELKLPLKQKIEVYKLDQIYNDLCQIRELNTPRTSRIEDQGAPQAPNMKSKTEAPKTSREAAPPTAPPPVPAPPAGNNSNNASDNHTDHSTTFTTAPPSAQEESRRVEGKGSPPEERRKRERDKEEESVKKEGNVKG